MKKNFKQKPKNNNTTEKCEVCSRLLTDAEIFFNGKYCTKHKPDLPTKKIKIQ